MSAVRPTALASRHAAPALRVMLRGVVAGLTLALLTIALSAGKAQAREIIHVVRKGQYLTLIAKRYHTSPEAIRARNGLGPKERLKPGQRLVIVEERAHARWRRHWERTHGHRVPEVTVDAPSKRSRAPASRTARHPAKGARPKSKRAGRAKQARKHAARRTGKRRTGKRDRFARKPRRRGRLTLMRFGETFRGQVVDSRGRTLAVNTKRLDRVLRSRRTGKSTRMSRRLLRLLTRVSDHYGGRTVLVVSGYRPYSPRQYTRDSRHNHGAAIDFRIVGVPNEVLYRHCRTYRSVGCGYYPNSTFVHMDVRKHKTHWIDYSRPGQPPIYARHRGKTRRPPATRGRAASRRAVAAPKAPAGASADAPAAPATTAVTNQPAETGPAPSKAPAPGSAATAPAASDPRSDAQSKPEPPPTP